VTAGVMVRRRRRADGHGQLASDLGFKFKFRVGGCSPEVGRPGLSTLEAMPAGHVTVAAATRDSDRDSDTVRVRH
jgi:hypothetical protein